MDQHQQQQIQQCISVLDSSIGEFRDCEQTFHHSATFLNETFSKALGSARSTQLDQGQKLLTDSLQTLCNQILVTGTSFTKMLELQSAALDRLETQVSTITTVCPGGWFHRVARGDGMLIPSPPGSCRAL